MPQPIHHTVTADESGDRIDRIVARAASVSRRVARTWIAAGRVRVGSKTVRILSRTTIDTMMRSQTGSLWGSDDRTHGLAANCPCPMN